MQSAEVVVSRNDGYEHKISLAIEKYKKEYGPISPEREVKKGRLRTTSPRHLSSDMLVKIADAEGLRPALIRDGLVWNLYLGNQEVYHPMTGKVTNVREGQVILMGEEYAKTIADPIFGEITWGSYRRGNLSMSTSEFDEKFKYRINLPDEFIGEILCSDVIQSGLYCLAVYEVFKEQ